MGRHIPAPRPRRKPGPAPRPNREGVDFYCGVCTGHKRVPCEHCVEGDTPRGRCLTCGGIGEVQCPGCLGGAVPTPVPQWLPGHATAPTVSSRGVWRETGAEGAGRVAAGAASLADEATGNP